MDTGFMRLIFAIIIGSIPFLAVQFLILSFSKKKLFIYIIPSLTFIVGIFYLLYARFADLEGFSDLAYLILGIILLGIFAFVLIFSFIINVIRKRK